MKYAVALIISLMFAFTAGAQTTKTVYTCPMHPQVIKASPGSCPICKMTLVKKTITLRKPAAKAAPVVKKTAPAPKKAVTAKKPAVSKPKAVVSKTVSRTKPTAKKSPAPAKPLQKTPEPVPAKAQGQHSHETAPAKAKERYTCPMHPEIVSEKPGRCPKCGMDLVPVVKETVHAEHGDYNTHQVTQRLMPMPDKNLKGGRKVRYDLYVKDTLVNFAGKEKRAIAVNGRIPMPTLEFYEGDTAEIVLHNRLTESTSLHWHGLHLPNREDGVPWLTQQPIPAKTSYTYSFPIIQEGTHWYHSHSGLQEQIGMYGLFIMKKRPEDPTFRKGIDDLPTVPLILSEWTNLNPDKVQRMLHNANDWFAIKKGSTQSYSEAIREGHFKTKLTNEWKRMLAMDVSDIYYDAFLINGKNQSQLSQFKAGDKVRLRIANGGASTYFWLNYAGGKIRVVASDGNDIEPLEVDRLLLAVSETVDIIVEIPEKNTSYELMVTPEDRTKSASVFIGEGNRKSHEPMPKLKYFEGMKMMNDMMKMNGDMKDMGMDMSYQTMDMNAVMYPEIIAENSASMNHETNGQEMDHSGHGMAASGITTLNYGMMKSPYDTSLPDEKPVREVKFTLTGNMNRYVWSMDDRVLSESDKIPVKKGEILRITMFNNSMMRHPMHLHGFDFRVLNQNGRQAPLKNVIDVMPMETNVIEFAANEEGDWFFHCHILYHMMAGMNRVFAVGDYKNPLLPDKTAAYKKLQRESNMWHLMAETDIATNGIDGMAMVSNTRWELGSDWRFGYNAHHGYEVETYLGRYVDRMQWLKPFIGYTYHYREQEPGEVEKNLFGQSSTGNKRSVLSAGLVYTLPLLVNLQAEVYTDGLVRFQLMREDIPLTPRLRGSLMLNTDREYMTGLKYVFTRNLGVSSNYHSEMGLGIGLTLTY